MMAGDAMEKDRLPIVVGQQVGGLGHLLERRRDPRIGTKIQFTPVSATTLPGRHTWDRRD